MQRNRFDGVLARMSVETTGVDLAKEGAVFVTDFIDVPPLPGGHRPDDQGRRAPRAQDDHRRRVGPVRLEVAEAVAGARRQTDACRSRGGAKSTGLFDRTVKLDVLGPTGTWKLSSARGADVAPKQGKVGDVITVTPA